MQAVRLLLGKQPNLHLSPQACVNICILFLAMLSSIDLLNYSARESAWSHSRHELTRQEMLCPPGCLRAGSPEHRLVFDGQPSIDTAEQMHGLWCISLGSCLLELVCRHLQLVFVRLCSCRLRCQKHDRRVALLFLAFNYTAPLFMFNIALSTLLKFYMAPAAGWTGVLSWSCSCSCWPTCPLPPGLQCQQLTLVPVGSNSNDQGWSCACWELLLGCIYTTHSSRVSVCPLAVTACLLLPILSLLPMRR